MPAAEVPLSRYANMPCDALLTKVRIERKHLKTLVEKQEKAWNRDIAPNFHFIPGLSAAIPNQEDEIAMLKGKINVMG